MRNLPTYHHQSTLKMSAPPSLLPALGPYRALPAVRPPQSLTRAPLEGVPIWASPASPHWSQSRPSEDLGIAPTAHGDGVCRRRGSVKQSGHRGQGRTAQAVTKAEQSNTGVHFIGFTKLQLLH